MKTALGATAAVLALVGSLALVWLLSLPRLDPTGREDSSAAIRAMIEGRAVRNVATGWPVTKTGWPFFDSYSPNVAP